MLSVTSTRRFLPQLKTLFFSNAALRLSKVRLRFLSMRFRIGASSRLNSDRRPQIPVAESGTPWATRKSLTLPLLRTELPLRYFTWTTVVLSASSLIFSS